MNENDFEKEQNEQHADIPALENSVPEHDAGQETVQETVPEIRHLFETTELLNSRHYKDLGFNCAFNIVENARQTLLGLLAEQKSQILEQREGLATFFATREKRYAQWISEAEKKIDAEKISLQNHLTEIPELTQKSIDAEKERTSLEQLLAEKIIDFGKRKSLLVAEAIESVRNNLNDITENYRTIYEQRFGINQLTYKDNLPALAIKIEQFKKIKIQVEAQWNRLISKMEYWRFDGINPALANWLFYVGIGVATVCGAYFFSIFVLAKQMNDANITFFVLTGFERFIIDFYPNWTIGERFLMLMAWLLGLSLLISFLTWGCWKLLAFMDIKSIPEATVDQTQNIQFELSEEPQLSFELKAQSSNFFKFWLQILPIIVVLGIFFFISFLGQDLQSSTFTNSLSELQKLDISLTGAAIGTLLTLLVAALSYLYIINVIEPRSERVIHEHPNLLMRNIELIIASIIFIISLFLLFFLEKNDKDGGKQQSVIFQYCLLIIANGFLLGYSLRLKGLFASINFLERKMLSLTNAIRDNSRPRPINLTAKEDRIFQREYFRQQRELYNLMLIKTQLGNQALGGQNANRIIKTKVPTSNKVPSREKFWRRFLTFSKIKEVVAPADSPLEKDNVSLISIEDWESRLYPAETLELEQIGKDLARARIRSREAKERMEAIKENRSEYCEAIQKRLKSLEDSINRTKIKHENDLYQKALYMRMLRQQRDSIQSDIREGFNLGVFFRSEVEPDFKLIEADFAQDVEFEVIDKIMSTEAKPSQLDENN